MNGNNIIIISQKDERGKYFMKKSQKNLSCNGSYSIGLDIGTNSVGFATIDSQGNVIKFGKKNVLGSRLFEAGEPAASTRVKRGTRRRYNRRKYRIKLLRDLLSEMILPIDENFFRRLDEGFLFAEDKSVKTEHILFNDTNYMDKDYFEQYKTIYHLRQDLMTTKEKKDIRLIYLALHHLIKYRGHFIFEGQKFANIDKDIVGDFKNLIGYYNNLTQYSFSLDDAVIDKIVEEFKRANCPRAIKADNCIKYINEAGIDSKVLSLIIKFLLGYAVDLSVIFEESNLIDDAGKNIKISLSDPKLEENEDSILEILSDKAILFEICKKIYSWFTLQNVLQGEATLSAAMINKYNKHHDDLKLLQDIIRTYYDKKVYNDFFRKDCNTSSSKVTYIKNYVNYIAGEKRCSREEFYESVKKILEKVDESIKKEVLSDIDENIFMPLLNTKDNSAIPYQLNLNELYRIIDNQGIYYKELLGIKDKIASILEFRIPYYVGPLNSSSRFSWIVRGEENIKPWNFSEVVDVDQTAEKFILRMTNNCTYLMDEPVMPRYSLLYTRFVLLNELNKIRINDKLIDSKFKQKIIENVFKKNRTVKENKLINYLFKECYQNADKYIITGYQKDKEFSSSLASYIDFTKIFGKINENNYDMIEQIIYWLTVFEEKEIVKRKINSNYSDKINNEQLQKILKLRYTGWSRLSKKLLVGLKHVKNETEKLNIMSYLEDTNMNFMQIINDEKLGFDKMIREANTNDSDHEITKEDIDELQGSPALKRGIWQTTKIVKEIAEIMGYDPENIFIEFAREDEESKRTNSRLKWLQICYNRLSDETNEFNKRVYNELKNKKYSDSLDVERLFLYFIQNGKCMYSGEPLDIDALSTYQVDHIMPRAYIKDDSIDNKALVKYDLNQYKSDKLLLDDKTRRGRRVYWLNLKEAGLISDKKFNNLMRESIGENEAKGFINRQLVETRQISKHVAILLNERYTQTNVVTIKAQLTHDFRNKYKLYKSRDINDFHHAHDALLAATIGNYMINRFPSMKPELIYDDFVKYYKNVNSNRANKYGYIIAMFDKPYINEDGKILWNGADNIQYIRDIFRSDNCRVTKKTEITTGAFYKETIYKAGSKDASIPLKEGLSVEKYGGYTGQIISYSVVVEYIKGKKTVKKLIGVPVRIESLRKTKGDGVVVEYLKQVLSTNELTILKDKVPKYQLVIEKGVSYYMTSDKEVINSKQCYFGEKYANIYDAICMYISGKIKEEDISEDMTSVDEVIGFIIEKISRQYLAYISVIENVKNSIDYTSLAYNDKITLLKELIKLVQVNPQCANLKKFGLSDRMGRKGGYNLDINNTIFVDQSITGLYERRYSL